MPMPKIAFMFLTYSNPHKSALWEDYFSHADSDKFTLYVHPKFPERLFQFWSKHCIDRRDIVMTRWGDISLVKATLALMKHAIKDLDNQWFILVSDSCIPVLPFNQLYDIMTRRLVSSFKTSERQVNTTQSSGIPLFKSSQWFTMIRSDVEFFMTLNNLIGMYLDEFSKVDIPDEKFFLSIMKLHGRKFEQWRSTYVTWHHQSNNRRKSNKKNGKYVPRVYNSVTKELLTECRSTGCILLRKVNANTRLSPECLTMITSDQ